MNVKDAALQEAEHYLQQTYSGETRLFYLYKLMCNDMRSKQIQFRECMAIGRSEEALRAFEKSERVEPYDETIPHYDYYGTKTFGKVYRKGGPLEWCNPCYIELFEPDGQWPMRELIRKITAVHHIDNFKVFMINEWRW